MSLVMDYIEAHTLLKKFGIKALDAKYVNSADEALSFSAGRTIVMKLISDKAIHKSKSGLVKLNLASQEAIASAYKDLKSKGESLKPYKILVQEQISGGTEIIIGGNTDLQFGKLILLGLGGIYVETFKDVSVRVCPISKYDASSMLASLKSAKIMAPDQKSEQMITDLLLKVSNLLTKNENINELDLNPIIIHDGTYDAVDLRIIA